jgi:hypothetical protein
LEKAPRGVFQMFSLTAAGLDAKGQLADDETLAEAARQASIKKKENAIKASFKIGMNEEEKKVRDLVGTN